MTTERDRGIDALRAIAILGVVFGHWLVTAVVMDGGKVHVASPLRAIPWLAPASWLFQTLALFFFVGGMVAARSTVDRYLPWLRARLTRLFRPVLVLLLAWSAVLTVLFLWQQVTGGGSAPDDTQATTLGPQAVTVESTATHLLSIVGSHTVLKLVASPLWFLLVFAALTAATPLVRRLHPAWPLAAVAVVDVARFGLHAPAWLGWLNLAAGWLVPFCLGAAWTRGRLGSPVSAWLMLTLGAAATVILTTFFGYPVSMVGVPGEGISNLNPPTLAAVTFGIAQCGAALLLMPALRRLMQRPKPWQAVAVINLSAMTIFLWHQTSLLIVTLLTPAPLSGLHTAPAGVSWLAARVLWLPVFAAVLGVSWLLFHRFEHRGMTPSVLVKHLSGGRADRRTAVTRAGGAGDANALASAHGAARVVFTNEARPVGSADDAVAAGFASDGKAAGVASGADRVTGAWSGVAGDAHVGAVKVDPRLDAARAGSGTAC